MNKRAATSRSPATQVGRDPGRVSAEVGTRVEAYAKGAALGPVAAALRSARGDILDRWLQAARVLPFHAADPDHAVSDHIPHLFDALVALLDRSAPRGVDPEAPLNDDAVRESARAHARDRFAQGLSPADVLTEFRLLRQEIGRALRERMDGVGDLIGAELLVNDALDGAATLALAALEAHEAERSRLRAELAAIVESSYDAILSKTLDGIITSWNPAAERLYGYSAAEVIGRSVSLIMPRERADELGGILERIRRGDRVEPYETVRVRKNGTRFAAWLTVSPIRDQSGAIVGASAITRDVSARIAAEHALRESEARFRTLADNISQLTWMTDPSGWIFWYNRRWFEYTGTTLDEMQGWGWTKVHHPEHVDRVVTHFREALERGEVWEDTFPLRGKDGQYRWFLSRAQPIRDERGQIVRWFGTNTDITELREAEAALRASDERRREVLEAIAHDLKNPLASIRGSAQLIQRQVSAGRTDPERLTNRLQALVASVDRMTAQVEELSTVTRGEGSPIPLDRKPVDVVRLVRAAVEVRQVQSEAHIIRMDPDVDRLIISGDARRLSRAMDNLLVNAIKYSPGGGEITVEVSQQRMGECDAARISVRDRGIGIPAEDLPRVFERFRRGSNVGEVTGTGIGLAAARDIVEAHGGTVGVESAEGEGTIVTLRLPLSN